jgi:nitroreductase
LVNRHIKNSAFTVVGCAYTGLWHIGTRKWSIVGTSIALQNMIIAAWAMGVGSCWIGDFGESKVKQSLNIPDKWKVVALISFGYPAEKPEAKKRKRIEEIVGFNMF